MQFLRLVLVFGLVIIAFVGGTVFMTLAFQGPRDQPLHAMILPQPRALPQFSMRDQNGAEFNAESLHDQWSLLFFGFTHCPDICPATLQILAQARKQLAERGQNPLPRIVLVSVDPERDTPELMSKYVSLFGDGNLGITGDLEQVAKLTEALGIYFAKAPADDGNYSVDHSTVVLVINPQGRFQALFSAPHRVEDIAHDLPLIMALQ